MPYLLVTAALGLLAFAFTLTPPGRGVRRWAMAWAYDRVLRRFEEHAVERKRALFADVAGTVLELGPGTGANLPYLPDDVERWIGVEPNPHMHPALLAAAERRGLPAEIRGVTAEAMEVADASVDVVVGTFVLCSVPDPAAVVRDVRRVLRPGGRYVFLEHVAAPPGSGLRRLQHLLRPVWSYLADGCQLDRELGEVVRGAGFRDVRLDAFVAPPRTLPPVVSHLVAGVAIR